VSLAGGGSLVLLVENKAGYGNLCRLLTTLVEHPAGVTHEDLARFSRGLICLCGEVQEPAVRAFREIFGSNLALEISPYSRSNLYLARRLRIPLVAAVDPHY